MPAVLQHRSLANVLPNNRWSVRALMTNDHNRYLSDGSAAGGSGGDRGDTVVRAKTSNAVSDARADGF